jgi:hypothetical protein
VIGLRGRKHLTDEEADHLIQAVETIRGGLERVMDLHGRDRKPLTAARDRREQPDVARSPSAVFTHSSRPDAGSGSPRGRNVQPPSLRQEQKAAFGPRQFDDTQLEPYAWSAFSQIRDFDSNDMYALTAPVRNAYNSADVVIVANQASPATLYGRPQEYRDKTQSGQKTECFLSFKFRLNHS